MYLSVQSAIADELCKSFASDCKMSKRLKVVSDSEMFLKGSDQLIVDQAKGKVAPHMNVFVDDEYICGFSLDKPKEQAILDFWKGFKQAYQAGRVHLRPGDYELEKALQPKEETLEDKLAKIDESNPTVKKAKEIIRRVAKKSKKGTQ